MSVSRLAKKLKGSEIIKIAGEINELKKQGQKIANLTIGDFDPSLFPIPEALKDGIKKAYDEHNTNYPPADGILPLRENISSYLKNTYALDFNINQILVSCGSRPLIYSAYMALVDPGDKVIYPAPSWNNDHYSSLVGAVPVAVTTSPDNNFMPSAEDLRPHVKGATLLALCSPLNPTGTMFTKKDLEEICDLVLEENSQREPGTKPLYVIYDQIYSMLTFGKHVHYDPVSLRPAMKDYVIYVDGASKCFASTGVRVGWGFGPAEVIEKMKILVMHMGAWAPKPEQFAMAAFLQNKEKVQEFLLGFKLKIQDSLNTIYTAFKQFKEDGLNVDVIEPMGAIYLTLKIDYAGKTTPDGKVLKDSEDINFYLIKEAKAAFVPFSAFGADSSVNWFRASIGACSLTDINEMLPRVKEALLKLK
ncbi:Aspartate aminotransferase [Arcticibacter svalbardensis MN12-7]|uniref:Aspartate aminotransferase n=1 Tax=Arcticibacter svalbardensis MN12-7 TaxID=1150600 RepID=R9GSQ9_9SPHI|nr:aminotransferase class I/II-fold pyridoxal phosphate-dependent enzyme [Arcticibacter svalbardensis]EOR94708.1 Aspartate aminotransferase [Arcticibacter svalbardensis MN12-7]